MEAVAPRAEQVAVGARHRNQELDRRARHRPPKGRVRRGPAVPSGSRPAQQLELPQRRVGVRAEHAVEDRRREAVPGERELERRDVPPAAADRQVSPPERPPPSVPAEGLARARSEHAVRGEARPALEPHDRPLGARAENAVDRPVVQAVRPEPNLKGGHVRAACTGGASREGGREEPEYRESRPPRSHGALNRYQMPALPSPKRGNQNEGSNPHSGGRRQSLYA